MSIRSTRVSLLSLLASLVWICFCLTSTGQEAKVSHQTQSKPRPLSLKNYEQYIAYWTAEPGWHTELQLRNNRVSADLTVTPALRTANGAETVLAPVTIRPGEVVPIDLSKEVVQNAPPFAGGYGSVVLRYSSPTQRVLYAAAMIRLVGAPIAYHIDASFRDDDPAAGSRSGIWWLPTDSVKDYLILTNYGDQKLDTTLALYNASGAAWSQPLSLAARQTARLSLRSLVQQAGWSGDHGGFKIEMARNAAKLDSLHVVFDEQAGFSALMKMFGYDPTATLHSRSFGGVTEWTTRAPMLALTEPDPALAVPAGTRLHPEIFLHNTSGKSYTAHIRFDWRSATGTGKTAPIDLALQPNQTSLVDVAALQAQKLIPADAHWAAVILSGPMQPDELMAVATSFDQTLRYGAQTPFNDQLAGQWEAGMWEVDGTHDSLVTIGNGGNQPVHAELTILYNHGTERYRLEKELAPDETMLHDFGKLIRDQIADSDGHTLPPDLTMGAYRIKDLSDPGRGSLYEGKVIVEKTYGHAHYGCALCCGIAPYSVSMLYNPLAVGVGSSFGQTVQAPNSCDPNEIENITGDLPNWGTGNSAIATVNPAAKVNGIKAGTTTHFASGEAYAGEGHAINHQCPQDLVRAQGNTNVTPQIDSISPSTGQAGGTSPVVISGSGFGASPSLNVSPSGIQTSGLTVDATGNTISAVFNVPAGIQPGPFSVSVSVPSSDGGGSQTSNSVTFTVTSCATPSNFQRQNWTANASTGELDITYAWSSSTGNTSDLAACTMAEYVTYPGTGATYTWPGPPFGQQSPNPTALSQSGANTFSLDKHLPPGSWVKPYIAASFTANQVYQYVCPCANGGNQVHIANYTITRSVTKNSDGTYRYTVTKSSGESATRNPLPKGELTMPSTRRYLFCFFLASLALAWVPSNPSVCAAESESRDCAMVVEALNAAARLRAGMVRADVEKDFELDGGLSVQDKGTFTYRRCHYIKVDVEFRVHKNESAPYTFSPQDEVLKISKPYLAYPLSD
ncbi:MAG TPA: IPT/TIG domain-containing protein [Candidatus Sulfotelmatobacter sp.]|nr:IPT/TIG domain-containing protein [Candidatus Sulfotelmatobacter sp.]